MVAVRLRRGCLACSAWTDADHVVHYQEDWATEADVRERVRSEAFTLLLAVVEASEGVPHVQFDFVTKTRGLDYVAEARDSLRSGDASDA